MSIESEQSADFNNEQLRNQLEDKFNINLSLLDDECNINIIVPATGTARIQEMHILIGHIICQLIDLEFNSS